jgi:outer membrane protein, heavy metal efflux system
MKWRSSWVTFALMSGLFVSVAEQARAEPLAEAAGVVLICRQGPHAALARAERLHGWADVEASRVLPNPTLVVTHQRALNGPTDTETLLGLSVPLGIGGRRFVLQDAARARQAQASAQSRGTMLEAALEFRQAYATAAADRERLQAATEQQAALTKLSARIKALAKGGEAAGYDLLRQETQARIHARALESLRGRAARSQALLDAWTGQAISLPEGALFAVAGKRPDRETAPSLDSHPRAERLAAEAQAGELEARAARRRWLPELEVFAGYRATDFGTEQGRGIALGLNAPLTFFDHGQGEAIRADATASVARAQLAVFKRKQRAAVAAALAELDVLVAARGDAEQVAVDAQQVQLRAEQLYAAGEASITELLDACRATEEARFGAIALGEQIAQARLALMEAQGSLLDPNLDQQCGIRRGGAR